MVKFPANRFIHGRREANSGFTDREVPNPVSGLLRDVDCRLTLAELFQRFLIILTATEA
jgi:hypothetical protein